MRYVSLLGSVGLCNGVPIGTPLPYSAPLALKVAGITYSTAMSKARASDPGSRHQEGRNYSMKVLYKTHISPDLDAFAEFCCVSLDTFRDCL